METKIAPAAACGIPGERGAALAGRALEGLLARNRPESARLSDETVTEGQDRQNRAE